VLDGTKTLLCQLCVVRGSLLKPMIILGKLVHVKMAQVIMVQIEN